MSPHSPHGWLLIGAIAVALGVAPSAVDASAAVTEGPSDREIARANSISIQETREILSDPTSEVGAEERIYYVEPTSEIPEDPRAATRSRTAERAPLVDTFGLHSKAGSTRTIYLDFDGADVSGTAWNNGSQVSPGFHEGWDPDNDGATFNDSERARIQEIFYRVAEDFAAFDVDVTTEEPSAGAISRSSSTDENYGTRVLISESDDAYSKICGRNCGGVAYVGVFNLSGGSHDYYQPAWVFPRGLSDNSKNIAEAASHEVGHNLGLKHDGKDSDAYYNGHKGWAPLMGVGYLNPISQWSKGEYPGATETQDDIAVMASNGVRERVDEAGAGVANAAPRLPETAAYISSRSDVDTYSLGFCSGEITVAAEPAATGPNLDVELTLLDALGGPVEVADPVSARVSRDSATGMSAAITRIVTPGPLYASVDGVGRGEDTGYTDYGSLGAYSLSVEGCTYEGPPSTPRELAAQRSATSAEVTLTWAEPTSDGGPAITGYAVLVDGQPQVQVGVNGRRATFPLDDNAHTLEVLATNRLGSSDAAQVEVAAVTAPESPASIAATRNPAASEVDLTWSRPNDGGVPISGYRVTVDGNQVATAGANATSKTISMDDEAHTVRLIATNRVGDSAPAKAEVAALGAPTTPRALTVARVADGSQANITWQVPADTGGPPLSGYRVELDGTLVATPGPGARQTLVDFDDDTHAVSITATNRVGESEPTSVRVPAITVPARPAITAVERNIATGEATVRWQAPATNGGAPVTEYSLAVDDRPALILDASRREATVSIDTGAHQVALRASNRTGDSTVETKQVAPVTAPGAPGITQTRRDASAQRIVVEFISPSNDGGAPVTGYQLWLNGSLVDTVGGNARGYTFTGVTAAAAQVAVKAVNLIGAGPADQGMAPAVSAPSGVVGLVGARDGYSPYATLVWAAPSNQGNLSITGYDVVVDGRSHRVTGRSMRLDVGPDRISVIVYAVNALGRGPGNSVAVDAQPEQVSKPGKTGFKRAKSGRRGGRPTAKARWRAPRSDGSATIERYKITAYRMRGKRTKKHSVKVVSSRKSAVNQRLPHGRYAFRVQAKNQAGWGRKSKRSNVVRSR